MNNIKLGVKLDDHSVIFELRAISVAEENRYTSRFLTIGKKESEERKSELEYGIYVDALSDWAAVALVSKNGDDKESPLYPDMSPAESVKEFFRDRNPDTERIAPAVILRYRQKIQPDVVFF